MNDLHIARHLNGPGFASASRPASGTRLQFTCCLLLSTLLLAILSGCVAIPINRLRPLAAAGSPCGNQPLGIPATSDGFSFLLPAAVTPTQPEIDQSQGAAFIVKRARSFAKFAERSSSPKQYLPEEIRDHPVTNAFIALMTKVSGQAQLDAAVSKGLLTADEKAAEQAAIDRYSVPNKLSHNQMKSFADKLFDHQLRPGLASLFAARNPGNSQPSFFETYFTAYYNGKFVDRMGQSVTQPIISTTIPDTEIAAAETVLLEFLIDLFDPTPVLGDADTLVDVNGNTNFYPGGGPQNRPTAFSLVPQLANYQQINPTGCGLTTKNICLLTDLANGASNRAAAIGGLVENTPGGLSFGLGVIGKISIGDNQTLSTLVKTAASRLALRVTYSAGYWTLQHIQIPAALSCNNFPAP